MNSSENARPTQPGAGRVYTLDELLKAIEPQYQMYKLTMRQCIAGLTAHAAQLTAQGQEEENPLFRRLCIEMAEFWGLTEDDTPKGYRETAEQIGSAFDNAVSAARDSGQAPKMRDQARQDILDGLELYAREMEACGDMGQWIKECEDLSKQLKTEWKTGVPPDQVRGEETTTGRYGAVREMDRDAFWSLIAETKRECGQNMDASFQHLAERLTALGPQQAQDFHDILHGYHDLARQYGLWSAATLMCENGCTDDGFIDFRMWLIAQGKEVYLAALADPDSLANVEAYGGCQFEELSCVGSEVLKALTGKDAYDSMDSDRFDELVLELKKGIQYGEGINYPYEWDELETYFPRLCEKYLEPGTARSRLDHGETIWFLGSEEIQKARAGGPPDRTPPQTYMNMGGGM